MRSMRGCFPILKALLLFFFIALFNFGASVEAGKPASVRLKTIYNSELELSRVLEGQRAVVLYFMHDTCPVVQFYLPRLKALDEKFAQRGVRFVGIYTNRGDYTFSMATHAAKKDIPFLVLYDRSQALLDLFQVERTSTAVLLDSDGQMRFKGPIDDQFTKGRAKSAATRDYLPHAIESLLAGKDVSPAEVPVSGCLITRHREQASSTPPTFYKDVLPIVQQHCQVCHRPGEGAPFSLLTYEEVADWSSMIGEVVEERRMPPWRVVSNHPLVGDEQLTSAEVETIAAWGRADAPLGDPADSPPPREWPAESRWKIGQPDWETELPQPFNIPASGVVEYQYFPIKNPFAQKDRWVAAIETAPGNKRVVHHIQVHVVKSLPHQRTLDPFSMMALFGLSADNANLIGGYAMGDQYNARQLPEGYAMRLPAGHDLVMELHYTPTGEPQQDRSRIAFKFADAAPEHELKSRFLHRKLGRFVIPAGAMHHRMETDYWFERSVKLHSVRPHMHLRGKHFQLDLVYPAGRRFAHLSPPDASADRTETILWAPAYDFNWQRTYAFAKPLFISAGAELRGIAHFDNSPFNPANPDPSKDVYWGQQIQDEMFAVKLFYEDAEIVPETKSESPGNSNPAVARDGSDSARR